MFGYIICDKKGIEKDELLRYRAFYCGICRKLSEYGQTERLFLNYDMTFLALFLSAMYEPEEKEEKFWCAIHPTRHQNVIETEFTDYAAAMTIALAYHKCLDDWLDDGSSRAKKQAECLKPSYEKIKSLYPRQCSCIEKSLELLHTIEKDKTASADAAITASGLMLSEIFVYRDDFWAGDLRQFGTCMGRFVYLMDATCDYSSDVKHGSYNPLIRMDRKPEDMEQLLCMEIGPAAQIFERLPIVNDSHLIKNILYSGVWQKYDARGLSRRKESVDIEEGITGNSKGENQ